MPRKITEECSMKLFSTCNGDNMNDKAQCPLVDRSISSGQLQLHAP